MKIALVHDYLIDFGGAERVLATLHEIFPDAPIYVSVSDEEKMGKFWKKFSDTPIHQSWFGKIPFASRLISPLRFMLPAIWSSFDFSGYDLIISSASWAVTKGFKKSKGAVEICYLHTPPRYLYGYSTSRNWKNSWLNGLVSVYSLLVNHFMRQYDFKQAQKVDFFLVNSKNVGRRAEKFYRRSDYAVIYPPVEVEKIINSSVLPSKGNYFLTGGRLVAAKNFDLVIKACKKAKVNLKVFGSGIQEDYLRKIAGPNTEFLGRVDDEKLISLYKGAKAFILAQADEDFGMTPVEAAAGGCPSIAYRAEGYLESVIEGKTGMFFDELTVSNLTAAINQFKSAQFNSQDCIRHAKEFSKERFIKRIKSFTKENVKH